MVEVDRNTHSTFAFSALSKLEVQSSVLDYIKHKRWGCESYRILKKLLGFIKALAKRRNAPNNLRDTTEAERAVRTYRLRSFKFTIHSKIS